ncbi:hypothetical protein A3J20_05800 [Candidatus Gottesmanbacteria bacterium RIFCSPLOWO2_02_FULL_42_29]|uniref:phosphoribosylglycinamide formyltransferase 1 n=2 Tax=Candidatus Gottesmaniibacteriota TaxID=1752720 RepID=A0A1F6BKQ0_9BACT|nr:MAG: Phosphoribosylglycinamide formyltransferase [Candidatus Gottesmanbacteria bacterium GW2011_GWA2_42_18]KKS76105.1 MAG: Phosphoribosylglycinamide formyltransferase [Candidatus Gottesmanbacteria bacterium GW2011_GWC2_42_8]OGG09404.1 MAG: hypothetical protein A2781_01420 [Candidatus Gottesmanbacteria bacterium RIFCSPHIGHO2_01_FULL_42_27]OGG23051.1 MAG: hypothetical protein A3E72_03395 [Candidatus Gottesmanbacteria bacterium RIFCSPHIGHO2_12_FULL_43_26]OGG36099.1 MAG: hypothetical protein A3G
MLKLALFISGGGSTAEAVIVACRKRILKMSPSLVVASKRGIGGIEKAHKLGMEKKDVIIVDPLRFATHQSFGAKLICECQKRDIDIIGQFGWLPLTPPNLISEYKGCITNQHPGPLDPPRADFGGRGMYGRRVHAAVILYRRITKKDFWTEATCHLVNEQYDRGEIVGRSKITISQNETVESLQAKVLPLEHKLQIEILKLFTKNKLKILRRTKALVDKKNLAVLKRAKEAAVCLYPSG